MEALQSQRMPEKLIVDGELMLHMSTAEDAEMVYRAIDFDRSHLVTQLDFVKAYTLDTAVQNYVEATKAIEAGTMCNYLIWQHDTFVGTIGMKFNEQRATMGYWLLADAEGQRIASRSARALQEYVFSEYGTEVIELDIKPENSASQHVAQGIGAQATGRQITEVYDGQPVVFNVWEVKRDGN